MKAVIDRFEDNNFAVLELNDQPGNMLIVPCSELPDDAQQGDVLSYQNGQWALDRNETIQRNNEIEALFNNLLSNDE